MAEAPVDIPHHYQETEVTCGPAALRMVFDALLGLRLEEEALVARLGTDDKVGTRQRAMERFLAASGLETVRRDTTTTLAELRRFVADGHVVLVCYFLPEEGVDHYALVSRVTKEEIFLADPWYGPDTRFPLDVFDRHWFTDPSVPARRDRWLVAVRVPAAAAS